MGTTLLFLLSSIGPLVTVVVGSLPVGTIVADISRPARGGQFVAQIPAPAQIEKLPEGSQIGDCLLHMRATNTDIRLSNVFIRLGDGTSVGL